jgi:hypothetical protein
MIEIIPGYGDSALRLKINEMIETINSGGVGGAGVLALETGEPVPTDPAPTAGTFIVRTDPPPAPLVLVAESLTTYRSTSSNSWAIPYPEGIETGDLLVACIVTNSQSATITPPAGWVKLQQQAVTGDFRAGAYYGLSVTGTPPTGDAVFTSGESNRVATCMFRVTGANLTTPVAANGTTGSRVTTVYTVPALTGVGGTLLISMTQGNSSSPNDPDPLAFSNDMEQFAFVTSADDTGVTRTWLNVRFKLTATDLASFTVTSPSSVASMGSEVLAIGGTA